MSDAFYNRMAQTTLNLIKKFGTPITFSYMGGRTYDEFGGKYVSGKQESGTLHGIVKPAATGVISGWKDDTFFGENLRAEKQRLLVLEAASSNYVPKKGHGVVIDGTKYKVLGVTAMSPTGIPLVYKVGIQS